MSRVGQLHGRLRPSFARFLLVYLKFSIPVVVLPKQQCLFATSFGLKAAYADRGFRNVSIYPLVFLAGTDVCPKPR